MGKRDTLNVRHPSLLGHRPSSWQVDKVLGGLVILAHYNLHRHKQQPVASIQSSISPVPFQCLVHTLQIINDLT